jgi:hypothetical protein
VRVAAADVDGDGRADLVDASGLGTQPHGLVSQHGQADLVLASFFAYGTGFQGGVYVGSGDLDGDGIDEIFTGAGAGADPHVKAFDILNGVAVERASFDAFDPTFTGGVTVDGVDRGDGRSDLVTAIGFPPPPAAQSRENGGPSQAAALPDRATVFDGQTFSPVDQLFALGIGGVFVAGK